MRRFPKVSCCFGVRRHNLQVHLEPRAGLCLGLGAELLEGQLGRGKRRTDPSAVQIHVSCFLISPFSICFDCVGSPEPRKYMWMGPGGPNTLVFANGLKSPLNRKIEITV